ncbi:HupE/UreJ family protein [Corallococcus carmarthensis]|uniref:HupE/UreJ family protein n=1 Tax=Corallococcus carmarthensis TaxID=2316728 RepID=A0A3A8KUC2_9BACT|nr:HupE/UreJ family protein [Corallococcus carmarthensis]NOK16710.1 HupE/UreJ family protein [Corallococcus carmarthensis]RKH07855.1 HupE/UreJ family protein [Corallococcus carmarthensis]
MTKHRTWALGLAVLLVGVSAHAHLVKNTAVLLDVGERAIQAEVQLPLDQLSLALTKSFSAAPADVVRERSAELPAYLREHFGATAPDGRPFDVEVGNVGVQRVEDGDCLVAHITLRAPPGASARVFTLNDTLIIHEVMNHRALVSVRRDFHTGLFGEGQEMVGAVSAQTPSLRIDRTHGSWWTGFQAVFRLGVHHIAEGTDHLLFLLVLLLPAPLLARKGRWREPDRLGPSLKRVLHVVTAFTVGHSLTLAAAAVGMLRLPSQPVEVLIAVSILVSAVHAVRPLFPGREPVVAAMFGLVHGLAFATVLAGMGFDSGALAMSILGFNLGIEVMQAAVVLLVLPWLLLWSRGKGFTALRIGGAAVGGAAACGWVVERALGVSTPLDTWVEAASRHAWVGLVVLAVVALGVSRRRAPALMGG